MTSEDKLQAECFQWAWNNFPELRKLFFAVPNETGKKNPIQQARAKAMGLVAGVADLVFVGGKKPILFVEMKLPSGSQSPEQKVFEKKVSERGLDYILIRDFETFKKNFIDFFEIK